MAQYNLSGDGDRQLIGGVYYRMGDAVIAMVGLEWSKLRLTFTYDATMSSLKTYNNSNGALEFSLVKYGAFNTGTPRQSRCPSF